MDIRQAVECNATPANIGHTTNIGHVFPPLRGGQGVSDEPGRQNDVQRTLDTLREASLQTPPPSAPPLRGGDLPDAARSEEKTEGVSK